MNPAAAATLTKKAEALGVDAGKRIALIVTKPVIEAALIALQHAAGDSGGGAKEELLDVVQVRIELSQIFNETAKRLNDQLYVDMLGALNLGYDDEVKAQNEALPESIQLKNATAPDWLTQYPIVGNDAGSTALHNSGVWRFGAEGAVGVAASTGNAAVLPIKLNDLAQRTESVSARSVEEAYVAGQQAARKAIGIALSGALNA